MNRLALLILRRVTISDEKFEHYFGRLTCRQSSLLTIKKKPWSWAIALLYLTRDALNRSGLRTKSIIDPQLSTLRLSWARQIFSKPLCASQLWSLAKHALQPIWIRKSLRMEAV